MKAQSVGHSSRHAGHPFPRLCPTGDVPCTPHVRGLIRAATSHEVTIYKVRSRAAREEIVPEIMYVPIEEYEKSPAQNSYRSNVVSALLHGTGPYPSHDATTPYSQYPHADLRQALTLDQYTLPSPYKDTRTQDKTSTSRTPKIINWIRRAPARKTIASAYGSWLLAAEIPTLVILHHSNIFN